LLALGADLRDIWQVPTTTARDKKELLRALLEEIIIAVHKDEGRAHLTLRWRGGALARGLGLTRFRHAAPLALPLILNIGRPFRIALGRQPGHGDGQSSFAAGLFPGPVLIDSDGRAECVQIDFKPLGAYRFYGGTVSELTARMVSIEDVKDAISVNELPKADHITGALRLSKISSFTAQSMSRRHRLRLP
jgi:hypothetical protein